MYRPIQIYIVVEPRYRSQAQPAGLICSLEAQGVPVTVIDSNKANGRLHRHAQCRKMAVVRGRSREILNLVSRLETRGVRTINCSNAIRSVLDKASMGIALQKAGIPTPATFYEPTQSLVKRLPKSVYPLILKPVFGDNARGLRMVCSAEELAALDWIEPLALAQSYLMNDGYDLKLYGIGREIWAVRKPSPLPIHQNEKKQAELIPITAELRRLARQCGALFGLELFGVDCVMTPSGPVVIEVNDFPTYSAISGGNDRLADYVICRVMN